MTSFGKAASSHSGLIPLKTVFQKRGELLWAIARKKNFINPHSAAFVTVCIRNLVHTGLFVAIGLSSIFRYSHQTNYHCLCSFFNEIHVSNVLSPCKFQVKHSLLRRRV